MDKNEALRPIVLYPNEHNFGATELKRNSIWIDTKGVRIFWNILWTPLSSRQFTRHSSAPKFMLFRLKTASNILFLPQLFRVLLVQVDLTLTKFNITKQQKGKLQIPKRDKLNETKHKFQLFKLFPSVWLQIFCENLFVCTHTHTIGNETIQAINCSLRTDLIFMYSDRIGQLSFEANHYAWSGNLMRARLRCQCLQTCAKCFWKLFFFSSPVARLLNVCAVFAFWLWSKL